jgi:transposase
MFILPKAFPEEFRSGVVAVARKGEAPLTTIAKVFGVSPAALHRWLKKADEEDDPQARAAKEDSAELREAK